MADLFCFNPTNEMAVANNTVSWQPNRYLSQFERDLSIIPSFLSKSDDVLLSAKIPSSSFLKRMEAKGFELPNILPFSIDEALLFAETYKLNWLKPWGWSLLMHVKLKPLFPYTSERFQQSAAALWNDAKRELYGRNTALLLQRCLFEKANLPDSIPTSALPCASFSIEDLEKAHSRFGQSMLKAPWSSSGHGVQPLKEGEIHPSILNWSRGILKKQGFIMVEPLHKKMADFSFQFDYQEGKARFVGISFFMTTSKGQYVGTLMNTVNSLISSEIVDFVEKRKTEYAQELGKGLELILKSDYCGHLGIDAMVVLGSNGDFLIDPVVEINLRYNMGIVAMNVAKVIGEEYNMFQILPVSELRQKPSSSYFLLTECDSNTEVCAIASR